jgi:hypothetical protein
MLLLRRSSFAGIEILPNTPNDCFRGFGFESSSGKDPGAIVERMFGYDFTALHSQTKRDGTDAEKLCCLC